jgi:hypothetical protein
VPVFGCGAVFAGDRGVAALGGAGWAYGFTVVGLCEAVKVSTAKLRVLWLGASGKNSKTDDFERAVLCSL